MKFKLSGEYQPAGDPVQSISPNALMLLTGRDVVVYYFDTYGK